jgi:hypothetical protein
MATIAEIEEKASDATRETIEEIVSWLCDEVARRGVESIFHKEAVRYSELGTLLLPTTLQGNWTSNQDERNLRLDLEDAWNYREPEPSQRIRLTVPWNPELSIRSVPAK